MKLDDFKNEKTQCKCQQLESHRKGDEKQFHDDETRNWAKHHEYHSIEPLFVNFPIRIEEKSLCEHEQFPYLS